MVRAQEERKVHVAPFSEQRRRNGASKAMRPLAKSVARAQSRRASPPNAKESAPATPRELRVQNRSARGTRAQEQEEAGSASTSPPTTGLRTSGLSKTVALNARKKAPSATMSHAAPEGMTPPIVKRRTRATVRDEMRNTRSKSTSSQVSNRLRQFIKLLFSLIFFFNSL